jgi:hypothetical protein
VIFALWGTAGMEGKLTAGPMGRLDFRPLYPPVESGQNWAMKKRSRERLLFFIAAM